MTAAIARSILHAVSGWGYPGVIVLMALESACIPIPSELIMPFAGYLAFTGAMTVGGAAIAGTAGCLLGSLVAYGIGAYGGRHWIERYGRRVWIHRRDLEMADRWFARHGEVTVFAGRLLPVVRTFIALPAGIARMPLVRFLVYSAIGSYLWCLGLAALGARLGARWDILGPYFHRADVLIAVGVLVMAGAYLYYRRSRP